MKQIPTKSLLPLIEQVKTIETQPTLYPHIKRIPNNIAVIQDNYSPPNNIKYRYYIYNHNSYTYSHTLKLLLPLTKPTLPKHIPFPTKLMTENSATIYENIINNTYKAKIYLFNHTLPPMVELNLQTIYEGNSWEIF